MIVRRLFSDLFSVILPAQCHVCGRPLPRSSEFICSGCTADLPLASYDLKTNPISESLALIRGGLDGTAYMRYGVGNSCSRLIHDFKYRGYSRLARYLGKMAAASLRDSGFFNDVDMILPVPLHPLKQYKRGYNQAMEIALGLSDVTGIPVGKNLRAIRSHGTQTRLTRADRMDNVEGVFGVKNVKELEGRTLLIVDDVFTTGATLISASKAVSTECRAVRIKIFALATAHQ